MRFRAQIFWSSRRVRRIVRHMATTSSPESPSGVWRSWRCRAERSVRSVGAYAIRSSGSPTRRSDQVQAADGVDPGLGLAVGGGGGGDALGLGPGEDRQGGVVDVAQAVLGPFPGVAPQLFGDVDDPAGVHAVVGGVEDAGLGQRLVAAGLGQLVVGAAADGGA